MDSKTPTPKKERQPINIQSATGIRVFALGYVVIQMFSLVKRLVMGEVPQDKVAMIIAILIPMAIATIWLSKVSYDRYKEGLAKEQAAAAEEALAAAELPEAEEESDITDE